MGLQGCQGPGGAWGPREAPGDGEEARGPPGACPGGGGEGGRRGQGVGGPGRGGVAGEARPAGGVLDHPGGGGVGAVTKSHQKPTKSLYLWIRTGPPVKP